MVLMPIHNEADTVVSVLDAVREQYSGEILVVDDGSTDSTPAILASRDDVAVMRLDRNCGYGCALRIGFDVARELGVESLITMDCDGQHEPAHIPEFLETIRSSEFDIVSGSRYLPGSGMSGLVPPEDRRGINARITALINAVTGWSLTDAFCGFKAYRVDALSGLSLFENGYAMPLELWAAAWAAGLTVTEVAVERIYCDHDRSFGSMLDDPVERERYYLDVWERALEVHRG